MVSRKQFVLNIRLIMLAGVLAPLIALRADAQSAELQSKRFYSDDPLWQEPAARPTSQVRARQVDDLYDFIENRWVVPAKQGKPSKHAPVRAGDINTLGEVPNSNWYTNRHWQARMSLAELQRGAGNTTPPATDGAWQIIGAKNDGITPGLVIEDSLHHRYVVKFDPPDFPELASAADVISSKFFYALGYNTPENYIVHFHPENLTIKDGTMWHDANGKKHALTQVIVGAMLRPQPKDATGAYRALASRFIEGELVGPFNYQGTRTDDPNDIVAHENRRELRGLRVFAAWLNHTDVKQLNTMDSLVNESGHQYLKHYLIDFGSTLGSDANFPKNTWRGHVYPISPDIPTAKQIVTLGLYTPAWMRAHYPKLRGAGAFEAKTFNPESWIPDYPNPAFLMMDDADAFWASKQVVAFTDEEIRAIVETGELTDHRATDWIVECLIQRRDKIAKTWLSRYLPIDGFRIEDRALVFDDLNAVHQLAPATTYEIRWSVYDNDQDTLHPIPDAVGTRIPTTKDAPGYLAAVICASGDAACSKAVTVFLRSSESGFTVVGLDRGTGNVATQAPVADQTAAGGR
jgi:hypothetical protein